MNTVFLLDNQFANDTILQKEIKAIKAIKADKPNVVLNLSGGNFLRAKELQDIDLSGYILRDINLEEVAFADGATLTAKGSDLTNAKLNEVVIIGLDITNALIERAELKESILPNGVFDGVNGIDLSFQASDLNNSNFKEVKLAFACFNKTKLHDAMFSGGSVHGCHFHKTDLNHFKMTKCLADYTQWDDAKGYRTEFDDVNLSNSGFDGVSFTLPIFTASNLANSSFIDGDLVEPIFRGCDLSNVDFAGCTITSGDFAGSDMTGAKLGDAIFIKTDLTADCFKGADFTKYRKKEEERIDSDIVF